MKVSDCIITRRSIRKFTNQQIEKEQVEQILKAAMYAPTANNQQTFEFVLINDDKVLAELAKIQAFETIIQTAKTVILVCHNSTKVKSQGFWIQDLAASTQNMLLQATDLGLGSVWIGIYERKIKEDLIRDFFKLPETIIPFSMVALGYADEKKETPERFDEGKIHLNKW